MKILVIEDDPVIRSEVVDWLAFEGHEALSAVNGLDGVDMARAHQPDLVISDITMPHLDGYDVLRRLQSDPATAVIPFIFMSARSDRQSLRYGMDLGADDYLTKPFTHAELLSAVQTRLAKHALAVEHLGQVAVSPVAEHAPADTGVLAGASIKGYQIWEKIGEGGIGTVYKAYQGSIGREVAIKVLRQKYATNTEFLHRFRTEAELVARLEHPHIVPLYDYWHDDSCAYIVMRLLRRGSLRVVLQNQGRWTLEQTAHLLAQVTDALAVAHGVGIIHRDLKPDNILLDERNHAYLTDFGLAKNLISTPQTEADAAAIVDAQIEFFKHNPTATLYLTDPDQTIGTPGYLAPEQIRLQPLSPQSDIYSLGITVYEMLTGKHPFKENADSDMGDVVMKHLYEKLPLIHPQFPDIPATIDAVLEKATAKNWKERYTDVLAFAVDFEKALPR